MHRLCACLVVIALLVIFWYVYRPGCGEGINTVKVVTYHYTNWCPHCKQMGPIWDAVKMNIMKSHVPITFVEIDEDKAQTPGIKGVPTIWLLDKNGKRHTYPGTADEMALYNWILAR